MNDLSGYLNTQLENPDFAAEWERQQPERAYKDALIDSRMEQNMTQEKFAHKNGIMQSTISRIENGNLSPTIAILQQIADGIGKTLYIEFK
jgi:DNA-binding XRE family transcriptional regulator